MVKFLFWNINRKPIEQIVANLAVKHKIDVLVLAENRILPETLLRTLNQGSSQYHIPLSNCEGIVICSRFSRNFFKPVFETDHWTIQRLMLPERAEILLVAVHLISKLYASPFDQIEECKKLAASIEEEEKRAGHSRTILFGDLNMNPFEEGVFAAAALNATMTKQIARRKTRSMSNRQYSFFYNPMWGHFGDRTEGPPGTYYFAKSGYATLYWHMFDQVLLRPDLIDLFRDEELRVLTSDGNESFLSGKGLPNTTVASDHLPILFSLEL